MKIIEVKERTAALIVSMKKELTDMIFKAKIIKK